MLIAADLPQLQNYDDLDYLVDKLALDLSESHAAERIIKEIRQNLKSDSQRFNDLAHEFARTKWDLVYFWYWKIAKK